MYHRLTSALDRPDRDMHTHHHHRKRAAIVLVASVIASACTSGGANTDTGADPAVTTSSSPPVTTTTVAPAPEHFDPASWELQTPVEDLSSRGSLADTVTVGDTVVMVGSFQTGADGVDRNAAMWLASPTNLEQVPGAPFGDIEASVAAVDAIGADDAFNAQLIAVGSTGDDDGIRGTIWELSGAELFGSPVWEPVYTAATDIRFFDVVQFDGAVVAVGSQQVEGRRKPVFTQRNKLTGEWTLVELDDLPDGDIAISGLTAGDSYVAAAGTITEQGRSRPVVWTSGDAGLSWGLDDLPSDDANTSTASIGFGAGHYLITGTNAIGEGIIWSSDTALRWDAAPALINGERLQGLSFGSMTTASITSATDPTGPSQDAVAIGVARKGGFPAWIYWTPAGEQFLGGYSDDLNEFVPAGPPRLINASTGLWTVFGVPGGFMIIQPGGTRGGPGGPLPTGGPQRSFRHIAAADDTFLISGTTDPIQWAIGRGPQANLYRLASDDAVAETLALDERVLNITDIAADGDGGFVVVGLAISDESPNNVWVARLDNQGAVTDSVTLSEAQTQFPTRVFKLDDSWIIVGYSHPDDEPANTETRVWTSADLISWSDAPGPDTATGSKLTGGCKLADGSVVVLGGIRGDDLINVPSAWLFDGGRWAMIDLGIDTGNLNACAAAGDGVTILGSDGTNSVVWTGNTDALSSTTFDDGQQPFSMAEHDEIVYLIGRASIGDRWQPAIWAGVNDDWQPITAPSTGPFSSWTINDVVFDSDGDMVLIGQIGVTPAMWTAIR